MKYNEPDLFPCRVMIVAQNLIETRHQVSNAGYDSIKVTPEKIAEITGESIERIEGALRKLEDWGFVEEAIKPQTHLNP